MVLKIAIVISNPIQHFCPMYASWAKIENIQVKVFFGSNVGAVKYRDTNFDKEIVWDNLYLEEFDHVFLNGDKTLTADPNLDASSLDNELLQYAPNLLVQYGYYHKLSTHANKWALKNKVPIAYISDAERHQKRPFWKEVLKYPQLYFYFKKINYFFTIGNANESYYSFYKVPEKKFHRMMFSIDVRNYDRAVENKETLRKTYRNQLLIEKDEIVISVVGKLVDWKCQNHLIDLLYSLEQKQPQTTFTLLIAGSGKMEPNWKQQANKLTKNKAIFLGFVNPITLPAIYAATDVYIHPSIIEPHSLSISEAIYMGCPVIISNTCGSWGENDDVQIGKNGYVYKQGDIEDLEEKLLKIVHDNLLQEFGNFSAKLGNHFQQLAHYKMIENLANKNNNV
jgi:glycosyltransferase involved in cell wall biosynthesis